MRLMPHGTAAGASYLYVNAADYDLNYSYADDQSDEIVGLSQAADSPPVGLGEWSFMAMTFDRGTLRIYVNGRLAGERVTPFLRTEPDEYSTDDVYIGNFRGLASTVYGYRGEIDAVRIYDRALNTGEIQALFRVRE